MSPISGAPATRLALARRVVDLDLAGTIKVHGIAESDPLLSWVQGPRGLGDVHPYDSLWVRLVDLPEALALRGYEADCDVVVEVADEPAPWNAGRWRIRVKDDTADVTRTDDDAEVSLPVCRARCGVPRWREPRRPPPRRRGRRAPARRRRATCGAPSAPTSAPTPPEGSDRRVGARDNGSTPSRRKEASRSRRVVI